MSWLAYTAKQIRTAAILTTNYVASDTIGLDDNNRPQEVNQSILLIDITLWSLTSMELKIEWSDDAVNYYQQSFIDVNGGTTTVSLWEYTFSADGSYEISNPFKARFMKVSVKGTGTVTGSSCAIKGVIWIA